MTIYYSHDYANDTKLTFTQTADRAEIELNFTSEDPNYGTDTLVLGGDETCTMQELCEEELETISEFLDKTEDGNKRNIEGYDEIRDLSNTTLYAFEGILKKAINKGDDNMRFEEHAVVQTIRLGNYMNIATGNVYMVKDGAVGVITKVNHRTSICLVRFDSINDDENGEPIMAWVLGYNLKPFIQKKWYMTVRDASQFVALQLIENRQRKFAFCESDELEAKGNPEKHDENAIGCGWHGIRQIDGFFDNEPTEFIVAVGHYGGGNVGFGYVDSDPYLREYPTECARAVEHAICSGTGWDANQWIFIEVDEEAN